MKPSIRSGVNKKKFNYALASSMADGHVNFNLCQFMWKNSHFYPWKVSFLNAQTSNHQRNKFRAKQKNRGKIFCHKLTSLYAGGIWLWNGNILHKIMKRSVTMHNSSIIVPWGPQPLTQLLTLMHFYSNLWTLHSPALTAIKLHLGLKVNMKINKNDN